MKHITEHKSGGKIRTAKGFYIAVAICLLALAGVTTVTFRNTAPPVDSGKTTATTETRAHTTMPTTPTTARPVVVPATGVPDTRTTTTRKPTTTTTVANDLFIFPVSNVILRDYSDTLIYSSTLGEWCAHNGTDFTAELGQEVKATADGTVLAVREDPMWGSVIELDHGNRLITRYGGVAATVQPGETVKLGQVIGTVAEIPAEILDSPHIHLELLVNGNYQNPLTLIRGEAVRPTQATATTTIKE